MPVRRPGGLRPAAAAARRYYDSHDTSPDMEHAASGALPPEIADITERLERIERAVTGGRGPGDRKMA